MLLGEHGLVILGFCSVFQLIPPCPGLPLPRLPQAWCLRCLPPSRVGGSEGGLPVLARQRGLSPYLFHSSVSLAGVLAERVPAGPQG